MSGQHDSWMSPRSLAPQPKRTLSTREPVAVFDRARAWSVSAEIRTGLVRAGANWEGLIHRNDNDRRAAKEIVTARYFRDPPPDRAGRAPDCEDSRVEADLDVVRRALGLPPTISERGLRAAAAGMEGLLADRERLAPRRYRPTLKALDQQNKETG